MSLFLPGLFKSLFTPRRRNAKNAAVIFCIACGNLACSSVGPTEKIESYQGCASSCETLRWGRLVVGFVNQQDGALPEPIALEAIEPDGFTLSVDRQGCHDLPPPYLCTYEYPGRPDVTSVIIVAHAGASQAETTVALKPFNYCSRDVAYMEVLVDSPNAPTFGAVEYINPCSLSKL